MVRPRLLPVLIAGAVVVGIAVPACSTRTGTAEGAQPPATCNSAAPQSSGGSGAPLSEAGTNFGFAAFHRLFAASPRANTFISPLSISLALEMVYAGARGTTRRSMARVLGIERLGPDTVNRDAAALITELQQGEPGKAPGSPLTGSTPPTQLRIADSIWARQGVNFQGSFVNTARRYFDARATTLNFDDPASVDAVNRWVSCATRGKIAKIVDTLRRNVMVLVNAVYFQGSWTTPFDPRDTRLQSFTLASGRTLQVPMMHLGARAQKVFPYYAGNGMQIIQLAYGLRGRFSMIVVLPRRGVSLAQFEPRFTRANWGFWVKQLSQSYKNGILALPRVNVTYSKNLKDSLTAMGMSNAFSKGANFSGLCQFQCKITRVLHKTFLHVDEKGTTAAGVTSVGVGGGGGSPLPPFHMTVDRPFFVAIRDGHSGALLFLGAINHP